MGIMGAPMAENLLKAGYPVTGHTLEPDKLDRLATAGGTPAASIAEAVAGADVIVTMVPASPQVEAIAYGPDGILANARRGALLIDMSSITPQTSVDLAAAAAERGLRVLDAPVSGGEAGAIEAVLSIMVGGPQEDFDAARPLFEALGTTIVRCGPHGAGQTVKAANQLIVAVNLQACAPCPSAPWSPPWSPPCAHRAATPPAESGPYRTRTARATAAPATRDGGSGTPVAGPLRLAPHARHAGSGQSSPAIRACKCSSCQPSACNSALRMVPSSRKPALSATRQDAGLATECESRSRCRPSSCTAHRLIRTVADTASPRPRPAGSSQ
ncbi:NAD(P)-binding domain-containing protein [Streptomyces rimosus]|uniref:NAD(P)-binding domain-containing protein n=2 Tax=Streptomyces TaxID=1883 RepID=UPI001F3B9D92|nr:NAD(P)-binding domain-containing protein [Streptomyces rimosus]